MRRVLEIRVLKCTRATGRQQTWLHNSMLPVYQTGYGTGVRWYKDVVRIQICVACQICRRRSTMHILGWRSVGWLRLWLCLLEEGRGLGQDICQRERYNRPGTSLQGRHHYTENPVRSASHSVEFTQLLLVTSFRAIDVKYSLWSLPKTVRKSIEPLVLSGNSQRPRWMPILALPVPKHIICRWAYTEYVGVVHLEHESHINQLEGSTGHPFWSKYSR